MPPLVKSSPNLENLNLDPIVKWLSRNPVTVVSRVQIPLGSFPLCLLKGKYRAESMVKKNTVSYALCRDSAFLVFLLSGDRRSLPSGEDPPYHLSRNVAQFGRALALGASLRRFKSCHSDQGI